MAHTRQSGRPGRYAGRLYIVRLTAGWLIQALAMAAALALVTAGFGLAALIVGLAGHLVGRYCRAGARRARVGRAAERQTARRLAKLGSEATLWGFRPQARRGDIDAVVLGPWLVAIEIKYGAGRVNTRRDGRVGVNGRWLPGSPLRQAVGNAAALRRAIGTSCQVDAVLCITAMTGRSRTVQTDHGPVLVTSARRLNRSIRRLAAPLDPDEGLEIANRLATQSPADARPRNGNPSQTWASSL